MPAKIKRSPRVSRRPLTIAEKPAILRAALLGEPTEPKPTRAD